MTNPDWIAVDWGTTNLRVWAMGTGGAVLDHAASGQGMLHLAPDAFEPALLDLIGDWLPDRKTLVLAAGMVGARQGWIEAPYAETPCTGVDPDRLVHAPTRDPRLDVRILPGLCQRDPADVMRGEETQIFGFLSAHPDFAGMICLPGTHSKWVQVSSGCVTGFHTAMTGELFDLLSSQSVLRHSMGRDWSDAAFLAGVSDGLHSPNRLTASLFAIRANSLLRDLEPGWGKARLSGLLIGAELAAAGVGESPVALIGGGDLTRLYSTALDAQGTRPLRFDAGQATRLGLTQAYLTLTGATA